LFWRHVIEQNDTFLNDIPWHEIRPSVIVN
jgi:hypothetical protein